MSPHAHTGTDCRVDAVAEMDGGQQLSWRAVDTCTVMGSRAEQTFLQQTQLWTGTGTGH